MEYRSSSRYAARSRCSLSHRSTQQDRFHSGGLGACRGCIQNCGHTELVCDIDPNLTNVLIGEDWTIWRIDFSRAFLPSKDLREPSY